MNPQPRQTPSADRDRAAKVDRLGEIRRQLALVAAQTSPLVDEEKQLVAEIQTWFADKRADCQFTLAGAAYTLKASECRSERTITDKKKAFALLRKAVGSLDAAIELVTISLTTAVDRFIPEAQHHLFLKQARTGSRKLECVRNNA